MPRLKTIKVAALNIKTHPHSPGKYTELFQDSFNIKAVGKIRGADWGIIGSLHHGKNIEGKPIRYGMIYRYLNIDPNAPWLDFKSLSPIDEADPQKPPIIPEHLKPNLKMIPYIFYPNMHRFFFTCKSISPEGMRILMSDLFKNDSALKKYGQVDISVESTHEAIEKILMIPRLTQLYIAFSRPNDDDLGSIGNRIIERIERQRIGKIEQTLKSSDKDGIAADDETKAFMNIAKSNGKIWAKGYDDQQRVEISTVDHPFIGMNSYDPKIETEYSALLATSDQMLGEIKKA